MLQNARVLRPEFVPRELQHRDHEHTALTEALNPLNRDERADPVIITGLTGVGKARLTKFTLERLWETEIGLETALVNCWQNYSGYRALFSILENLGRTLDVHRQSTPQDELVERLRDYDGTCVIVLDEADQLEHKGIIYDLRRMPSSPSPSSRTAKRTSSAVSTTPSGHGFTALGQFTSSHTASTNSPPSSALVASR